MNQRRKLTKDERMAVYRKTNGRCAYCGCVLEYKDMQVDHIIPINGWSEQGEDTMDNMQPLQKQIHLRRIPQNGREYAGRSHARQRYI